MKKHIDAISSKYIIPGVTSDQAILFLPAEAIFAEVNAYHTELLEYAYKKRVWVKRVNGNILEVPFENGMHIGTFKRFLSPHKKSLGIGPTTSWIKFIEKQYLKVVGTQIYFLSEDELWDES